MVSNNQQNTSYPNLPDYYVNLPSTDDDTTSSSGTATNMNNTSQPSNTQNYQQSNNYDSNQAYVPSPPSNNVPQYDPSSTTSQIVNTKLVRLVFPSNINLPFQIPSINDLNEILGKTYDSIENNNIKLFIAAIANIFGINTNSITINSVNSNNTVEEFRGSYIFEGFSTELDITFKITDPKYVDATPNSVNLITNSLNLLGIDVKEIVSAQKTA